MTIQDSDRVQLRHEAEHVTGLDLLFPGEGYDNPRIVPLPLEAFRPPAFLHRTAPDLYAEIEGLLREVWELNEQCVGERLLEAEAHLVFADLPRPLIKRIREWIEKYLLRRLQQDNPRDNGMPAATCKRLEQECKQILFRIPSGRDTIAATLLPHCTAYAAWFLFERLIKPHLQEAVSRMVEQRGERYWQDPVAVEIARPFFEEMLFGRWLQEIAAAIDPEWLMQRSADSAEDLCRKLRLLVDDIQQMRPLLIRNFRPERTVLEVSPSRSIAFEWAFGMAAIGVITHASSVDELRWAIHNHKCRAPIVNVDLDGLLHDTQRPWVTTADIGNVGNTTALHVNLYLLELIHRKLFSFYDQIDFEAIRRRLRQPDKAELDDEELSVTCQDLAEPEKTEERADEAEAPKPRLPIVPLRLQRLLIVLQEDLGCEVSQGKGSEITVYRPGGRKYVLGRHKADYAVPVPIVKALLSRVGIQAQEWIAICRKGRNIR